jgi:hypothetical protein
MLGFPHDLPHLLQNRVAGKKCSLDLGEPFLPDNSLLINQEEGSPRSQSARLSEIMLQDAVAPNNVKVWIVAEEGVRQLQGVGKRLLRERAIGADPKHLDIQLFELLVVGPPGRDVRRSSHAMIVDVELEEHQLFAPELVQADLASHSAGKREVRRLLPNLYCHGNVGRSQHTEQQQAKPKWAAHLLQQHTPSLPKPWADRTCLDTLQHAV